MFGLMLRLVIFQLQLITLMNGRNGSNHHKTLNIINSGLETIVKLSNNDQSEFRNKVQFDDNIISKGTITNYENNSLNISSATTLNLSSTTVINIEAPTINIGYSNLSSTIYLNGVVVRPLDDFFNMFSTNNGNITQVGF